MKSFGSRKGRALLLLALIASASAGEKTGTKVKAQDSADFSLDPGPLAAVQRSGMPPPILVLVQPNVWAAVIGSDYPAFALYADGTAIFRESDGYKSVQLTPGEIEELIRTLKIEALLPLKGYYQATYGTDQMQSFLFIFSGARPFYISTYGSLDNPDTRSKFPDEITAAYDRLLSFTHPRATDWLPRSVEVMISPYEYAPDSSIQWPKDWPGLDSPTTVKRGDEDFSLYIPSEQLERLRAFLATRHPRGAIEIGGKKWSASTRFPFPHEKLWMSPKTR